VPELWADDGDTFIYLFPKGANKGPCFRLSSEIYNASPVLTRLAYGRLYSESHVPNEIRRKPIDAAMRHASLHDPTTPPMTPDLRAVETDSTASSKGSRILSDTSDGAQSDAHLYMPLSLSIEGAAHGPGQPEPRLSTNDISRLVGVRNLFAFLVGGSLVATEKTPDLFDIFLQISDLLQRYEFSNFDGSTFGEAAATSFEGYIDELNLADVRMSREKTIEGIVLGERMRSESLYNEAYVHGVGKYDDLKDLNSPKFGLISSVTQNRMARAAMNLELRRKNIDTRLLDFEFPAIFAGIMNSKTADDRKKVHFDAWKTHFMTMRKHVLSYYKHKHGAWPPKAHSKKNQLETGGLNRMVLKELYSDLSQLYDCLVDRTNLTTRVADVPYLEDSDDPAEAVYRALRRVLSEYDRSSPPVQPAVPFDVPILPNLAMTRKDYGIGDEKADSKARSKKLKDDEISALLRASHNRDADILTPFLDEFRELELRQAHSKTIDEICDFRIGGWIFLYAVLQSLPLLVVDAPGIKHVQGVEYFLCEVPRAGVPWAREEAPQRNWYGIAGSSGVVSLPAHVVEHSVDGIYRRSHCWEMADKWTAHSSLMQAAVAETVNPMNNSLAGATDSSATPPQTALLRPGSARSISPSGTPTKRESVMMLGLEALPLPAGVTPADPAARPRSSHTPTDPTKTFDAILGSMDKKGGKKKK
jgi:hypothetical protein